MVIAVPAVRVVEVTVDQIVDVVAVRDCGVAAAGSMDVVRGVTCAPMLRRAVGRMRRIDGEHVLVDVPVVRVVEVTVVEVVDVPVVLDGEVPAAGAMGVVVTWVDVVAHVSPLRAGRGPASLTWSMAAATSASTCASVTA